jgi:hypothetical protein
VRPRRYGAHSCPHLVPQASAHGPGCPVASRIASTLSGAGMPRSVRLSFLLFLMWILCASTASATTYYIAASGSDSNNGTSKTTPWLHAPGMTNCSATCASATPQAGDSFVVRGDDTWHYGNSSLTPYVGGTSPHWNWGWAGSSGNGKFDGSAGAIVKTSCIYIGSDDWRPDSICYPSEIGVLSRPSTVFEITNGFGGSPVSAVSFRAAQPVPSPIS